MIAGREALSADVRAVLDEFFSGPWGDVTQDRDLAAGLCVGSTLALVAKLEDAGIEDWTIHQFIAAKAGANRGGQGARHLVLTIGPVMVDIAACQFPDEAIGPKYGAIDDEIDRWVDHYVITDPDHFVTSWGERQHAGGVIPVDWRERIALGPYGYKIGAIEREITKERAAVGELAAPGQQTDRLEQNIAEREAETSKLRAAGRRRRVET